MLPCWPFLSTEGDRSPPSSQRLRPGTDNKHISPELCDTQKQRVPLRIEWDKGTGGDGPSLWKHSGQEDCRRNEASRQKGQQVQSPSGQSRGPIHFQKPSFPFFPLYSLSPTQQSTAVGSWDIRNACDCSPPCLPTLPFPGSHPRLHSSPSPGRSRAGRGTAEWWRVGSLGPRAATRPYFSHL